MVQVADVLATHLAAQGHGTVGTSIFIDWMPDSPDAVVALYNQPGTGPLYTGGSTPITQPNVQVITRGAPRAYQAARTKAQSVWTTLNTMVNVTVAGVRFVGLVANDEPTLLTRDTKERVSFVQNWVVTVERT